MSKLAVKIDGVSYEVELDINQKDGPALIAIVDGQPVRVVLPDVQGGADDMEWMVVDDRPYEIYFDSDLSWIKDGSGVHEVELHEQAGSARIPAIKDGRVRAPIPGQINRVQVSLEQTVEAGETIAILEAMKMFNELRAPRRGLVKAIHVTPGQNVSKGEVLVEIE